MDTAETLEYGGKTYKTVKIGTQIWMAENLNYAGPNGDIGRYYDNDPANGEKYGRLYAWEEAMKVCPEGWHLPSKEEWEILMNFAGGEKIAGKKLKAKDGWFEDGNGTDDYGFSALPGGLCFSDGNFIDVGSRGYWWSSAYEHNSFRAYYCGICYCDEDTRRNANKFLLISVRFIKDHQQMLITTAEQQEVADSILDSVYLRLLSMDATKETILQMLADAGLKDKGSISYLVEKLLIKMTEDFLNGEKAYSLQYSSALEILKEMNVSVDLGSQIRSYVINRAVRRLEQECPNLSVLFKILERLDLVEEP